MDEHTRQAAEALEGTIHQICGDANKILDKKLHDLFIVLEDIGKCNVFSTVPKQWHTNLYLPIQMTTLLYTYSCIDGTAL